MEEGASVNRGRNELGFIMICVDWDGVAWDWDGMEWNGLELKHYGLCCCYDANSNYCSFLLLLLLLRQEAWVISTT